MLQTIIDGVVQGVHYQDISDQTAQIKLLVTKDCTIKFDYLGITYSADIHAGFVTDMGSVPEIVRSVIPNTGSVDSAYLLHDLFYSTDFLDWNPTLTNLNKNDADTILYFKLKERGLGSIKAALVYQAVRWFANGHYRVSA